MAGQLDEALRLMERALSLLDAADAYEVAPHLDMAIQRLGDLIAEREGGGPA
jgi:hypothetical protein